MTAQQLVTLLGATIPPGSRIPATCSRIRKVLSQTLPSPRLPALDSFDTYLKGEKSKKKKYIDSAPNVGITVPLYINKSKIGNAVGMFLNVAHDTTRRCVVSSILPPSKARASPHPNRDWMSLWTLKYREEWV